MLAHFFFRFKNSFGSLSPSSLYLSTFSVTYLFSLYIYIAYIVLKLLWIVTVLPMFLPKWKGEASDDVLFE